MAADPGPQGRILRASWSGDVTGLINGSMEQGMKLTLTLTKHSALIRAYAS